MNDYAADELAYLDYKQGKCSYEEYLAVCEIEECEPNDKGEM